jgi:hypothetical protein
VAEDAFTKLLLHHIERLEDADEACRETADARRVVLQAAAKDAIDTGLLKMVTRARRLDEPVLKQLRRYQEVAFSFMETPLGKAAETKPARAKPAEKEETDEDETWTQPEDETEEETV